MSWTVARWNRVGSNLAHYRSQLQGIEVNSNLNFKPVARHQSGIWLLAEHVTIHISPQSRRILTIRRAESAAESSAAGHGGVLSPLLPQRKQVHEGEKRRPMTVIARGGPIVWDIFRLGDLP